MAAAVVPFGEDGDPNARGPYRSGRVLAKGQKSTAFSVHV